MQHGALQTFGVRYRRFIDNWLARLFQRSSQKLLLILDVQLRDLLLMVILQGSRPEVRETAEECLLLSSY